MWIRKSFALVLLAATLAGTACASAAQGESCSDEGRVGGDCQKGLMCARKLDNDTSDLVCLKPCDNQTECAATEICSGERGRNQQACRPR
jgi:hypothetical protein